MKMILWFCPWFQLPSQRNESASKLLLCWLEANLSRSGVAFRSTKYQVFLLTKLCYTSWSKNITHEMCIFSPYALSTEHIYLSCRLFIAESEYRSSNDRLWKDRLFFVTPAQCSAKDLELGGPKQMSFSIPESLQNSSPDNTIMVSYSEPGIVWHNRVLNISGAFGHSTKL